MGLSDGGFWILDYLFIQRPRQDTNRPSVDTKQSRGLTHFTL